jgi:hypothetical protein
VGNVRLPELLGRDHPGMGRLGPAPLHRVPVLPPVVPEHLVPVAGHQVDGVEDAGLGVVDVVPEDQVTSA